MHQDQRKLSMDDDPIPFSPGTDHEEEGSLMEGVSPTPSIGMVERPPPCRRTPLSCHPHLDSHRVSPPEMPSPPPYNYYQNHHLHNGSHHNTLYHRRASTGMVHTHPGADHRYHHMNQMHYSSPPRPTRMPCLPYIEARTAPKELIVPVTGVKEEVDSISSGSHDREVTVRSSKKERGPNSFSFPNKLHQILSDSNYQEYINWLPHGRAWKIISPKLFEEKVIPKFFRSERYASFMRQVNGWGFKRITEGPDLNAYYHEMFLRGLPSVCAKMRRPKKGQLTTFKDHGESPDFYKISQFSPLPDTEAEENDAFVSSGSERSEALSQSSPLSASSSSENIQTIIKIETPNGVSSKTSLLRHSPEEESCLSPPTFSRSTSIGEQSFTSFGSWGSCELWRDGGAQQDGRMRHHVMSAPSYPGDHIEPLSPRSSSEHLHVPPRLHCQPCTPPTVGKTFYSQSQVEGLSATDLYYLSQQNRILIRQAHRLQGRYK